MLAARNNRPRRVVMTNADDLDLHADAHGGPNARTPRLDQQEHAMTLAELRNKVSECPTRALDPWRVLDQYR